MWKLSFKPSAFHALSANVPKNDLPRVLRGLDQLCADPLPNGRERRKLSGGDGLFRCKVHGFRVMYVFDDSHVSVLDVRAREDDHATYGSLPEPEHLGAGPDAELPDEDDGASYLPPRDEAPAGETPLESPITEELLAALRVPEAHHAALLGCATEEALLDCDEVPERFRMAVVDGLVGRPVPELLVQPDLVVAEADDLIRYREGELMGFLLRLNAEQEKYVRWAASGRGPTLLKGGPGTGKSTVALHRVGVFLDALRAEGVARPRVLFTTYTRALTRVSEQLLRQLLGDDARFVEVSTADSVAVGLYRDAHGAVDIARFDQQRELLEGAVAAVRFSGNSLQAAAKRKTIARLGLDYLLEEVSGVIEARGLTSLESYAAAGRPGRGTPLGKTQREAVWEVREAYVKALAQAGLKTWEQVRAEAAALAEGEGGYDAVLVDEAQDLQPSSIRMLVGLAAAPNRLFLTADANQSIYGAGFRWKDVHEDLRFMGRTGILKANHRSTRENGDAAEHYLSAGGALDDEDRDARYVHRGPLPVMRRVGEGAELELITRFIRGATRALRLGTGSAAVLCPTRRQVRRVVAGLQDDGLPAVAADADSLDLASAGVKVITLKSAKGLEFPVVVVAGLGDESYPALWTRETDEQRAELLERERRTMFVAMTRAMRALMVVLPDGRDLPLFGGFDERYWNVGA